MASLNRIYLVGQLASDLDVKATESGTSLARFTLSVPRIVKEGMPAMQDQIPVVCWGALADGLQGQLTQNALVSVEGAIHVSSFDQQDGSRKWVTEVSARDVRLVDTTAMPVTPVAAAPIAAPVSAPAPEPVAPKYGLEEDTSATVSEASFDFSGSESDSSAEFVAEVGEDVPF